MSRDIFAAGLMSGTSLDGIDAALVKLNGVGAKTRCELLHFTTLPIPPRLKARILRCSSIDQSSVEEICTLNIALGQLYSDTVTMLLAEIVRRPQVKEKVTAAGFTGELDFIASHGQTIYHIPQNRAFSEGLLPSTLQIGDPSLMALTHKTDVYFNFRMMDIAGGGEGAPLVPLTEWILYRSDTTHRVLQNIGGIGNMTLLPKGGGVNDLIAFDTGPGNMMINAAMEQLYDVPYDRDGEIAASGALIDPLYQELIAHPYLLEQPPKSTGREQFGEAYTQQLLQRYQKEAPNDLIHTLTRFTAYSIVASYRSFIQERYPIDEVILGGGGAYNRCLVAMIRAELTEHIPQCQLLLQEELGYSSDAKEAVAFAILGNQLHHRQQGNAPKATGAQLPLILGQIAPNPHSNSIKR